MAGTNKVKNATQRVSGKLKQLAGDVTGNDELRAEGKDDQTVTRLKQAGEKVKDAFKTRR